MANDPNFQRWKMMQDLNPGAGVWWANMPLPPGWDGKYDQTNRKYLPHGIPEPPGRKDQDTEYLLLKLAPSESFFIHHATRTTQWEDPRRAYYERQRGGGLAPDPAPTAAPQRSPVMPMHAGPVISMQPIAKPKCQTCKIREVPAANQNCQHCQLTSHQREGELIRSRTGAAEAETKQGEERWQQSGAQSQSLGFQETSFSTDSHERTELTEAEKQEIIKNLDEAFPGIQRSIVEMVLETSSWDSEKASSVLCTMSPQKAAQPKPRAAAQPKPPVAATAAASKPAAAVSSSPKKPTPAVTSTVSEANKEKMIAALKKMFPSASDTLVKMALETTKYDQSRSTKLLRMTMASDKTKTTSGKKEDSQAKTSTATSKGPTSTTTGTTISMTGQSTSLFPSNVPKTSTPTPVPTTTSMASSSSIATKTVSSSQLPAKETSLGALQKDNRTSQSVYGDAQSSRMNHGPDALLVSGANVDHLLDNYVSSKGSDENNCRGPMKENVVGPSGSMGHDPSLVTGPQKSQRKGAQPNLAVGSMYKTARQV